MKLYPSNYTRMQSSEQLTQHFMIHLKKIKLVVKMVSGIILLKV